MTDTQKSDSITVAPYLNVDGAVDAIKFYQDVFDAKEVFRLTDPNDGRVGHAELAFGGAKVMISDEYPDFGALGPATVGGTPVKMVLTVPDADKIYDRALQHGAVSLRKMRDEMHGHRSGQLADPFGHVWFIQSKTKDLSPAQMQASWDQTAAD